MKGNGMKRTIRGKVYDTKNSELCYFSDISSDFGAACVYMTESVWKTKDGDFFLCFDCEPKWHLFDAETRRSLKKKCKSITPITEYDVDLWLEEQDNIYM